MELPRFYTMRFTHLLELPLGWTLANCIQVVDFMLEFIAVFLREKDGNEIALPFTLVLGAEQTYKDCYSHEKAKCSLC